MRIDDFERLETFAGFETLLARPGPWLAACDFPFGIPRVFARDQGWEGSWAEMVRAAAALDRPTWRNLLDAHRAPRPAGDRTPHRATDLPARSHSPLKLVNPPVALMFHEGAPRLLAAGVHLPGLHDGDATRIAVEAYPGLLARRLGAGSYKADDRARQTPERHAERARLLAALERGASDHPRLDRPDNAVRERILADATGDHLDAVLAAVQAAACALAGPPHWGLPEEIDPLEGWIATA